MLGLILISRLKYRPFHNFSLPVHSSTITLYALYFRFYLTSLIKEFKALKGSIVEFVYNFDLLDRSGLA